MVLNSTYSSTTLEPTRAKRQQVSRNRQTDRRTDGQTSSVERDTTDRERETDLGPHVKLDQPLSFSVLVVKLLVVTIVIVLLAGQVS